MLISIEPSHALTEVEIACLSVNNFPSDLGQIWPVAVKKHNANPNNVTAASYMASYIQIQQMSFKIKDPIALLIYKVYNQYWNALEEDYNRGNGKLPKDGLATKILSPMLKACSGVKS